MPDSDLSAALDDIRKRWEVFGEASALPRLLAAVDAVLKAHHDSGGRCAWCRNSDGQRQKWPCGEYLTISAALLGEERPDA